VGKEGLGSCQTGIFFLEKISKCYITACLWKKIGAERRERGEGKLVVRLPTGLGKEG